MKDRQAMAGSGWCILRTSGAKTLPLAKSLAAAGFDVWTPIEGKDRRRPRSKARVEFEAPILPTFVFARAEHLGAIAECQAILASPHPGFSIYHHCGRVPVLADDEIEDLRQFERDASRALEISRRKIRRQAFAAGAVVRLDEGGFAGMSGVVKSDDGKFAAVCFGGSFHVKIASWLLDADAVEDAASERAPRHRNAAKYLRQAA